MFRCLYDWCNTINSFLSIRLLIFYATHISIIIQRKTLRKSYPRGEIELVSGGTNASHRLTTIQKYINFQINIIICLQNKILSIPLLARWLLMISFCRCHLFASLLEENHKKYTFPENVNRSRFVFSSICQKKIHSVIVKMMTWSTIKQQFIIIISLILLCLFLCSSLFRNYAPTSSFIYFIYEGKKD